MLDTVKVRCENNSCVVNVNIGTTLSEIAEMLALPTPHPFLAGYVNNSLKEMDYRVFNPVSVRFVDITHYEGVRVFQRTLFFTLDKAVHDTFPGQHLLIKHSVSKGFYCEIEGREEISADDIGRLKKRMGELIAANIPIVREKVLSQEAEELFEKMGYDDKISLLRSRPQLYSTIYSLADRVGYFYGALATSTGYIHLYDINKYYNGFHLSVPMRTDPLKLEPIIRQDKMFDIFKEYKAWVEIMGVSNIGSLNTRILAGNASELIKVAEAFHEKKLGKIADSIFEANTSHGARLILISGPSSSGKTTFAKRLGIQLRILGMEPVLISLDDYFVERDRTPLDADGEYDYEALEAIDVGTFNEHLLKLMNGGGVDVPRYDFITGKRQYHEKPLKLEARSVLVIEGIHALNPKLTEQIDDRFKFKIYMSALTSISMDDLSRIATTDNRLLRRIVRDYTARGSNAASTLKRWESVRRGEDKHIFPYQENCDVMFNSSLFYEISVLRRYVEPMLHEVPDTVNEYGEAQRLLKFINNFIHIPPGEIPPTSILREFIGGSSFTY